MTTFLDAMYSLIGITEEDMQPSFEQMEAITHAAVETVRKLEWIEANHAPYPVHVTEYTPTHAEMLDAWTAYTKRGQGITGRDAALGEYLRFMHATRQENA